MAFKSNCGISKVQEYTLGQSSMQNALNLIKADSEALAIMEKNTVMYMCEDIKNTIQLQKEQLAEKNAAIAERNAVTTEKDKIIEE